MKTSLNRSGISVGESLDIFRSVSVWTSFLIVEVVVLFFLKEQGNNMVDISVHYTFSQAPRIYYNIL